jgi:hypothetical protein
MIGANPSFKAGELTGSQSGSARFTSRLDIEGNYGLLP